MKISEFIKETFRQRTEKAGALVVYDPEGRFRDIVSGMADAQCTVVDAGNSYIEAHEQAVAWWMRAGEAAFADKRLIAYVPLEPPRSEEERCHDPFSSIAAGSDSFGVRDEDSFQSLCERAKPEHRDKIRELFATGRPQLAALEAVGGNNNWPQLQTLLGVESVSEIILALLSPTPEQKQMLEAGDAWMTEAKDLFSSQLGFPPRTKSKRWETLADELWRLVLFSEFAYDLPVALPQSLADVPVAKPGSQLLINRVCESLREERYHSDYIARADHIARELGLEERMRHVEDLGARDTFAFEERSFLRQYVKKMLAGDLGKATEIAAQRKTSVWVKHTDRGMLWTVAERAREVLLAADDLDRDLAANAKSLNDLLSFYARRGCRLDQTHREMETAVTDACGEIDGLEELLDAARGRYQIAAEKMQQRFVDLVAKEGWPLGGRLRATQVFDRIVTPLLETRGKRVALFFVDALRFELAVALERQLAGGYTCRLQPACAQLPTITLVGMAALLPKADGNLFLKRSDDSLLATLSGKPIRNPVERFAYVQEFFGDRARMVDLDELVAPAAGAKKKQNAFDGVELLLVKTTDIDEQGEIDAGNVCVFLPHILARLIAAVGRLKKLGFHHVVFSADHGFVLHSHTGAGNTVAKPPGDWLAMKDRCLLGSGSGNTDTLVFPKEQVGIPGDFTSYVVPKSFGTFNKRHPYFHEGLSLQENVIPVLEVDLGVAETATRPPIDVQLRYRGENSGTITTRRPVLDVCVFGGELFSAEVTFHLQARAKTEKGEIVVGEAASCAHVDSATGLVKVKTGQAVKIPLRIIEDFTGSMEVRAVDPETGVVYGLPIKLKAEMIA